MKKKILITSFDLAIGGVERSLIGLLSHIDYSRYDVDLLLFKHEGEFLPLLPPGPNLLPELPPYTTFRMPIGQIAKEGFYPLAISRTMAKYMGSLHGKIKKVEEPGYLVIQYGWEMSNRFLPKLNKEYDVAIGFLWPHHFIGEKVKAKMKIGWIHTDYSNIYLNKKVEVKMWGKLDKIVAVSEECSNTFLTILPDFKQKTMVIENILSPDFVRKQANNGIPIEMKKDQDKTILLTVGRLSHAKGIDNAIRACKELLKEGFDVEWYVVGYGPLEDELRNLIHQLELKDRFFLLGKKTNPYPYIKECDIYVQPSRYEGKAVTIREAQILGKPVVITNFPTANSQARDGIDALITSQDVEGIVKGVRKIIENGELKNELITNVRSMDYGNENEIEKLYSLIES
ncbi:glycosyltransferase [Neobacillus ginsengisoli]|uniref:Glycosyltransferase involved in cell wall biosynthesis n=1 Tax=Neobacillus ginsengisoli TaxID=904295 RepID=A0ABT9XT97_9BACI|nr:glycosyltransferase [Neobacillus ginsengisoli]MDQ0198784.1 glycosyltransferase involved in cell wall biosynthesis [Neobacillus ginsengisoli]